MTVIAAVDKSDHAKRVVTEAAKLAAAFDEPLHVIHAIEKSEFINKQLSKTERSGEPIEIDAIRTETSKIAEMASTAVEYPHESVGLIGDPSKQILRYAADHDGRYIVVGPRKRSPSGKVIFGSVTQTVLLNATVPVVTIVDK